MRGADDCERRLRAVRRVVCAALAAGVALSYRLWTCERAYPLAPVADWIGPLPSPFDHILVIGLLASACAAALTDARAALLAALGLGAMLAMQDQTRWQPWFYQYAVMLGVFALGGRDRPRACAHTTDACRAIVCGQYFWSGVQKLNASFLETGLVAVVGAEGLSARMTTVLVWAGVLVPFVEAGIGLGLLWPRTRRAAVAMAVATHVVILLLISPLAGNWNSVVWPWNAAMIALVVLLFGGRSERGPGAILALAQPRSAAQVVCVVAFWVLPALSFVGVWDSYLSASLYSKNIEQAAFKISPDAAARMPEEVRKRIDHDDLLWLMEWSLDELNVPAYPEDRVFKRIGRSLCAYAKNTGDIALLVAAKPGVLSGERDVATYYCEQLR